MNTFIARLQKVDFSVQACSSIFKTGRPYSTKNMFLFLAPSMRAETVLPYCKTTVICMHSGSHSGIERKGREGEEKGGERRRE